MNQATPTESALERLKSERLVRYADLRPCTTAFIDTRTPGRQKKENFTIIGPGVAENPDQYVHIAEPHGFNIGAARQPPNCINSQHSHDTAEVFVVHSGTWAFYLGADCQDGKVVLTPGDTISIPVKVFRGFENVGEDVGFLFAVLGGDDPGNVTWAPEVFEAALKYGLVLLEDGSLVDTTQGEVVPEGKAPMPPTTSADVARLRTMTAEELANCVVRDSDLDALPTASIGIQERPIIGAASPEEGLAAGKMQWPHGFQLRYAKLIPGVRSSSHRRDHPEVVFVHQGELTVHFEEGTIQLQAGDVLTVPVDKVRAYANQADTPVAAFFVRGGDHPATPQIMS